MPPRLAAFVATLLPLLLPPTDLEGQDRAADLAQRVEIVRTEFGIPHILAEDLEAMGFGLGYVQSQDYGRSIAAGLAMIRGTMSRHLGPEYLDGDHVARATHAIATETYHRLEPSTRQVYEGFAEGVNHYVRLHPDEFPEWIRPDFTGVDAHARDVQTWSRGDAQRFVRSLGAAGGGEPEEDREADLAFALDGSNAWALGPSRMRSGNTVLLRNPHLSWGGDAPLMELPSGLTYYEAHVRVPGVVEFYGDFRIGTAFGIIGGFNARLGWATTNNYPRYSQVYGLDRHPTLPDHAMLDGAPLPLTARTQSVDYRTDDGRTAVDTRSRRWTPYGPVIHETDERIYILKDPREGEFRRGEQFLRMMRATSLEEWLDVMRMRAHSSSNFTYADADGNIAHYYNARLPLLPHETTGDTAAFAASASDIWSELVPWEDLPLYVNPPGGYVQQANDTPDYTNLLVPLDRDTVAANLPDPRLRLRSQLSLELVSGSDRFDLEELIELKHTPRMLMAERVMDDLLDALATSTRGGTPAAREILSRWDRTAAPDSRGGVLFKRWAEIYFAAPDEDSWAEPWSADRPTETPRGLADADRAVAGIERALADLDRLGIEPDAAWGDVHRVIRGEADEPAFGCEPTLGCFRALSFETLDDGRRAANRGDAWVLFVEFADDRPHGRTVLSYGQTARQDSPHYDDQAAMFARGELKEIAWTDREISAAQMERYRPGSEGNR